jgi:hypothetical protein
MVYKTSEHHKRRIAILKPEKKTIHDLRKGIPPLTSENQFKKTQREINALNRKRSAAMELRVARFLGGRRTPSSGAMAKYKGDIEVELKNYPGKYVVECKLSAQEQTVKDPIMIFSYSWFPKIEQEAKDMNAKFAVVVIHFQDNGTDFVFISEKTAHLLIDRYNTPYKTELTNILSLPALDWNNGKASKKLYRRKLVEAMSDLNAARLIFPDQTYIVTTLDIFKRFVEHM